MRLEDWGLLVIGLFGGLLIGGLIHAKIEEGHDNTCAD